MAIVRRLARPMLAAIFVTGGLEALRHPGGRVEKAAPLVGQLAEATGMPDDPELAVRTNGALMFIGGAMLATNRFPRLTSALLASSLIPTTYVGHDFWNKTGDAVVPDRVQFFKNLGLLGGLILAAVDTEGKPGLTWRAQNATKVAKREARLAAAEARLALK
ncbi:MAG: DoxX family protein [Dermatophilus congolensis]|nr:DoxX family protein [Dermatophilus congolensis]